MTNKTLEIQASNETRQTLPADCETFAQKIHSDLSDNKDKIAELLFPRDPRGQIDDSSIIIDDVETEKDGSGIIQVSYTEAAFYGCSDRDKINDEFTDFRFTYDAKRGVIRIPIPDKPEYTGE
jgi:hypothetical protein